jgi:hypothetical protein
VRSDQVQLHGRPSYHISTQVNVLQDSIKAKAFKTQVGESFSGPPSPHLACLCICLEAGRLLHRLEQLVSGILSRSLCCFQPLLQQSHCAV